MKYCIYILLAVLTITNIQAQHIKIIAHRGAWKNTGKPQNSIAALQEAIKQEVFGAEFDVCLTKDNILVVNHDPTYHGLNISNTTYQELLQFKLANDEKIPTAEEYMIEGLRQHKTKMIYEIKTSTSGLAHTLQNAIESYNLVKKLDGLSQTIFISFSYEVCLKLKELDKNIQVQYLNGNKTPEELKSDGIDGLDYNYYTLYKYPNYIQEAKKLGILVNVWTVNTESDLNKFIAQEVDFITTDEPELLTKLLSK